MTVLRPDHFAPGRARGLDPRGDVYVEAGCGAGDSLVVAAAVRPPFLRVVGIDVSEAQAALARKRLNGHKRARVFCGNSATMLQGLLKPDLKTTVFLDAHREPAADTWAPAAGQCPLLAELRAVAAVPWRTPPVLMIDDYAAFASEEWWHRYAGPHLDRAQWPTLQQVFDALGGLSYRWDWLLSRDGLLYVWG